MKQIVLSVIIVLFTTANSSAQQLAFPTAEGYGKYTRGGRGGQVYEVTNLNDSGQGSLRAAVEASGPRTVVFRVSGNIELKSPLRIKNPYITIAGQTAPGEGICLKNHPLNIDADEVIVRYIRVRPGDVSGEDYDAVSSRYVKNIILDHISASWSVDETMSIYHCDSITVQWSLVSESMFKSNHVKGTHGFGGIWGSNHGTYHHNLLAHHTSRNPRMASGAGNTDYRNNVIYNWGYQSLYGGEKQQKGNDKFNFSTFNIVGNYYKPGPATAPGEVSHRIASPSSRSDEDYGKWYIADNFMEGSPKVSENNWNDGVHTDIPLEKVKLDEPWASMPIRQQPAEAAYGAVLQEVGASLPKRDAIDSRIIEETLGGFATYEGEAYKMLKKVGDKSKITGIIDSQNDVGGWPELKSLPAPKDSDHDGMPDAWERKNKLDPNDPSDGKADQDNDGYTNLEEYLNELVVLGNAKLAAQSPSKKAIVSEAFVFTEQPTRDCHASSILELENGDLLCVWFGGTREGHPDVKLWMSRKPKGAAWQAPVVVYDGDGKTLFNPVLVQLKGGDIQVYFVGPTINDGQVITSKDKGQTWGRPKKLPKGFVGPIVNKPIYLNDGTIIAGASLQDGPGRRVHVERSVDNGKTWTKTKPINDPVNTKHQIIQPTFLVHSQKKIQMLARSNGSGEDTKIAQSWSGDGGLTWSPVSDTNLPNNNSAIDAITLADGRHLLVYNHSTRLDPLGGRKGRGILTVAISDDGINWKAAAVLEYRTGAVQYSYPAVIQTKDGLVHITYSWHRKRIKHVVLDPTRFEPYPIEEGQWPKDRMPWILSREEENASTKSEVLN
ncbi:exo-alpha-sialidase [Pseudozobellia thermophila]|uniref:Predicted neuraminidase (Sialidase) n=1 Tax=Pseudozobellia thermophila TaxID=192903 RepID=A0A1M6CDQ5_9FLAO|nr:exo-alpha-sialidase [Pseudozobellia thermophila]SHI58894.1 Predicted neuraminidase (sialidase) [Pseudozobellia thermophila]